MLLVHVIVLDFVLNGVGEASVHCRRETGRGLTHSLANMRDAARVNIRISHDKLTHAQKQENSPLLPKVEVYLNRDHHPHSFHRNDLPTDK